MQLHDDRDEFLFWLMRLQGLAVRPESISVWLVTARFQPPLLQLAEGLLCLRADLLLQLLQLVSSTDVQAPKLLVRHAQRLGLQTVDDLVRQDPRLGKSFRLIHQVDDTVLELAWVVHYPCLEHDRSVKPW